MEKKRKWKRSRSQIGRRVGVQWKCIHLQLAVGHMVEVQWKPVEVQQKLVGSTDALNGTLEGETNQHSPR